MDISRFPGMSFFLNLLILVIKKGSMTSKAIENLTARKVIGPDLYRAPFDIKKDDPHITVTKSSEISEVICLARLLFASIIFSGNCKINPVQVY
jgi:hypothetical protein